MASVTLKTVGTLGGMSVNFVGAYEVTFTVEASAAKGELVVSVPIEGAVDTDVVSKARELLKAALVSLAEAAPKPEPMFTEPKVPF